MIDCTSRVRARLAIDVLTGFVLATTASPAFGVTIGAPVQVGTISDVALDEVSGLVASRANPNTLWVHNDSGDAAQFFAMSVQGNLLGTFPLETAPLGDWEDIAIGPKPGGGNCLYLGDIGDNNAVRTSIRVYRTDEPTTTTGAAIPSGSYTTLNLQYPGGPRDAESMFVDPLSGDLFIITKRTLPPQIYSVPATAFDSPGQTVTMTALGTLGGSLLAPTAADISPDGRSVVVRSSAFTSGYIYQRGDGQSVADALHGNGTSFPLGSESQGEAIGWAADGSSLFTTSEFDGQPSAPIHSYSVTPPAYLLAGDYNNDQYVDAADYTLWRNQLGANVTLPNESATPGSVTPEDYDVWRAHFGESLGGSGATATAIPEPATIALVAFTLVLLYFRKWM